MKFQDKYLLDIQNSQLFASKTDLLIYERRESMRERSEHVLSLFKPNYNGNYLVFSTNRTQENFSFQLLDNSLNVLLTGNELALVPNLRLLFNSIDTSKYNVCVDITTLSHSLIFLITKIFIKEVTPKNLFMTYTEPKNYIKINNPCFDDEEYDLYDEILGMNYSVPGFSRIRKKDNEIIIAAIGFERQRLLAIHEKFEPKNGLVPVIGFPSFKVGWNLTSLMMNYKVIEDSHSEQSIISCDAASPFDFYNVLKEQYEIYSNDCTLLIAPFGTRPHCLGGAIFAANHPNTHLIYDFPVEKNYRSTAVNKCHLYVISRLLE